METEIKISPCAPGSDTPREVEDIQIALLRKAGAAKRLQITFSLSEMVMNLSKRALKRANPGLSDFDLKVLFVTHCYGEELGEKFKEALQKRGKNDSF